MNKNFEEIKSFLKSIYKTDRFINESGWNNDREDRITKMTILDFNNSGKSVVSHHDNIYNKPIWFDSNLKILNDKRVQQCQN